MAVPAGGAGKPGSKGTRLRIVAVVLGTLGAIAALGGIGYGVLLMQHSSNNTDSLVHFVNTVTKPNSATQKQTSQAVQALVNNFNRSFQEDCDAKAHQLTYLGQQLGAHPDLAVFQSFCGEIGKP